MKLFKKLALVLCAATLTASVAALCACNNGGNEVKAEIVDLDVTNVVLEVNETAEITATLTAKEDGKTVTEKIEWVVEDTDIATVTVSEDGLTATVKAVSAGETVLNANIENEDGCASANITVNKPLGTAKLKLGGEAENNITFYDSNQYVVDATVIAAHDIQYRGEYSVVDGKLNFTPVQFSWGGFLTFNAQNVYKQKKQGAVLSISGKEVTAGDVKAILNVKFTNEDMQKLNLTPIAAADVKEVAKIAVLNTDDKVFVKSTDPNTGSDVYTLNLVSSKNDVSDATKQLDLSKYFIAVDANGEEPTEEEIKYTATNLTGTVRLDNNSSLICGLKAGMVILTVSSVDNPLILQNVIVNITYPEVEGFDLANDIHFAEEVIFTADAPHDLLGTVNRKFTFYADGTVEAEMLGNTFSVGYYKLDAAAPTKITLTLFNDELVDTVFNVTGTGEDAKFTHQFTGTDYNFEVYKAKVICATADNLITFYDDGTLTVSYLIPVTSNWKIESGKLVIEDTIVLGLTARGTVTVTDNGASIDYRAIDPTGTAQDNVISTAETVLSTQNLAKLLDTAN